MSGSLSSATAEIRGFLADADPARTSCDDAAWVTAIGAEIERLGVAVKTLFAARGAGASVWKDAGHRSAAHWLAATSGVDLGEANRTMETAEALGSLPLITDALRAGRLSSQQAHQITAVAAQHPST